MLELNPKFLTFTITPFKVIYMKNYTVEQYIELNGITDKRVQRILKALFYPSDKEKCFEDIESLILEYANKDYNENSEESCMPTHYTIQAIEPIYFIESNNLSFSKGNVVKYISRLGAKDHPINELKKVYFYFDFYCHDSYDRTKLRFGN